MLITIGNIFESKAQTLVNTVNCVGVMGKGIALEFKKRYPQMFKEYVDMCRRGELSAGKPYYYCDLTGASVINFPTKEHWRSPSKLSYIVSGLDWFVENYDKLGITSVAFPPLGCGNGGLSWETVGPVMYNKLKDLPIDIEIYAPYGTKAEQLTVEFLAKEKNERGDISGIKYAKPNDKWRLILYVVQELGKNRYSLSVGRTIFQKICYVLTRTGVKTGFEFTKGKYGPYAQELNDVITILSNENLIQETICGKMIKITVSEDFKCDFSAFKENEKAAVKQTVDLFSRIKNTEQAEIITTVLYAYDCLSEQKNGDVSDVEVYNFVMDWKKHWNPSHKDIVCDTIQNLAMLNWINISHSNELEYNTEL